MGRVRDRKRVRWGGCIWPEMHNRLRYVDEVLVARIFRRLLAFAMKWHKLRHLQLATRPHIDLAESPGVKESCREGFGNLKPYLVRNKFHALLLGGKPVSAHQDHFISRLRTTGAKQRKPLREPNPTANPALLLFSLVLREYEALAAG